MDRQRLGEIALRVRAEESDVHIVHSVKEGGMRDFQSARAVAGQVVDDQRIPAPQPPEGQPQVVSGRHQADLIDVGVDPLAVLDEEQAKDVGFLRAAGPAATDQPSTDVRIAARSGIKAELANLLQAGDIGKCRADLEVFLACET